MEQCRTPVGVNTKRIGTVIAEITSVPTGRSLIGLCIYITRVETGKGQVHKVSASSPSCGSTLKAKLKITRNFR